MSALAIMGGTFNPIHYGHLLSANQVRYDLNCDKVLFIPAFKSPYKVGVETLAAEHRFKMVQLAISNNDFFGVSDIEIKRRGVSYTVDTLAEIKKNYPSEELYFIAGVDAVIGITGWKNWKVILDMCSVIAVSRPGCKIEDLWQTFDSMGDNAYKEKIIFMDVLYIPISSSEIRKRVRNGEPIKYMLPDSVEKYIEYNGLYRDI